jgi:hypothetical protein
MPKAKRHVLVAKRLASRKDMLLTVIKMAWSEMDDCTLRSVIALCEADLQRRANIADEQAQPRRP